MARPYRHAARQHVTFEQVLGQLRTHNFAVLSTVDGLGMPHSAGVNYGLSGPGRELAIYVMTRRHLQKARNIARNPNISLVAPLTRRFLRFLPPPTIQMHGRAQILDWTDPEGTAAFSRFWIGRRILEAYRDSQRRGETRICFLKITPDPSIATYMVGCSIWTLRKRMEAGAATVIIPSAHRASIVRSWRGPSILRYHTWWKATMSAAASSHPVSSAATERQRRVWDKRAPTYDRAMRLMERLLLGDGRARVCSQAEGDVLEVAIGTGRNLPFYPEGIRLTGIELSQGMLTVARHRATKLGREVELQQGDAQDLPFPDAAFDTVVCTLALCSIPDDRGAVAEMARVLRPGGRLLLLDHVPSTARLWYGVQWLLEQVTLRLEGEHMLRRPLEQVRTAGFDIEHAERSRAGIIERVVARKPPPRNP